MSLRERLIDWMKEELRGLGLQIDLFSSGRAQFREYRDGNMTDVTVEVVARLRQRKLELEGLLADFGGKFT